MRIVLLSGGGGGARFARGLADVLEPGELTVVGNVGDDVEILGLHVSPDLDSLLYTLGGLIDCERGWGRADETWSALESAASFGGEDWFRLGDRDIGLHLVRTRALRDGASLSEVTEGLAGHIGLTVRIVPATDDRLRTYVLTPAGRFPFQEWFVGRRHGDEVDAVEYEGAEQARAAPGVVDALATADAIIFAPSNPYLSIGPILAVGPIRDAIEHRRVRCVAVSPLVGGAAVTGPAARMLTRMAGGTTPAHVTQCHKGLIDALVIDGSDTPADSDVDLVVTQTLMHDRDAERRLARVVLEAACA
jgi:LPPG:FO 2-phospho-L-lactate transferase